MERNIKNSILSELKDSLNIYSKEEIRELIIDRVLSGTRNLKLELKDKNKLINEIYDDICGYGLIEGFLKDPEVSEIMINEGDNIFYEKNGNIWKLERAFEEKEQLENILQTMVSKINRQVNQANPIVDVRLEDGSRVNIVVPPVAIDGPVITIRKFRQEFLQMEDLLMEDSLSPEAVDFLKELVEARYNLFVSGGTSSGKTTFLNLLAGFIPEEERLITIEDSAELKINHPNLVRLEMRNSNVEGLKDISIRDLIKTSLRMRPDRIIVGEVRGGEAFDMLTAMNTGHDGSMSTGHANSGEDMLLRLITMVVVGNNLKEEVAVNLIRSSIDYIIHLSRYKGKRFLSGIYEIHKDERELKLKPIFIRGKENKLVKVGDISNRKKLDSHKKS